MLYDKLILIITLIISLFIPCNTGNAPITVNEPVTVESSVVSFTYTNETGRYISDECWLEKLEKKVGDDWIEVEAEDDRRDVAFYVAPGDTFNDSIALIDATEGEYRMTIGYKVKVSYNRTETGYSSVIFEVT